MSSCEERKVQIVFDLKNPDIPGLKMTAFKVSETHVMCKMMISFSDVEELCRETETGLPQNPRFHNLFLKKLKENLIGALPERKGSCT